MTTNRPRKEMKTDVLRARCEHALAELFFNAAARAHRDVSDLVREACWAYAERIKTYGSQ